MIQGVLNSERKNKKEVCSVIYRSCVFMWTDVSMGTIYNLERLLREYIQFGGRMKCSEKLTYQGKMI